MNAEGRQCGYWRGRGHREEPVWSILSTPIPPPFELSVHRYEQCLSADAPTGPDGLLNTSFSDSLDYNRKIAWPW